MPATETKTLREAQHSLARRKHHKKKHKHKKKKHKHKHKPKNQQPPQPQPQPQPSPAPPSPSPGIDYQWVDEGDGLVDLVSFVTPPGTQPQGPGPRPLPRPQSPPAPAAPQPFGVYSGPFGRLQAMRLLNRAGFGPGRGQASQLAGLGLSAAVNSLVNPPTASLTGPAPQDGDGNPLAPADAWGHDHLWWLDRMVRSNQPLVERLALIFHDWFATSNEGVSKQQQMIDQSNLFRTSCFGSFLDLLKSVTIDPAMLQWLNGNENTKWAPNENYGREMMELFTLGADRGAYTENDVRAIARALTGWRNDWSSEQGAYNFRFDPNRHDTGNKTVFGSTGNWDWQDACRLSVEHPLHPTFFVLKLWSYFVPTPPTDDTRDALVSLYLSNDYAIRPVVQAILRHPDLYLGAPMVKPPVVYLASLLRGLGRFVDTDDWSWLSSQAGQMLFWPPNVSGWDDSRWLDTSTLKARWLLVTYAVDPYSFDAWNEDYDETESSTDAMQSALEAWDWLPLRSEHQKELLDLADRVEALATASWQQGPYRALRQNALRQLIGISPDLLLE